MSYTRIEAAREFGRWSESYDRSILQRLLFGPSHAAIIARLRSRPPGRRWPLLDVGCGTGVFASRVKGAFPEAEVWGVDLSPEMIRMGRERWKSRPGEFRPVQGDSERLPFATGAFDVVTCSNSFHHYPHQERAVAEIRRVLRPGGRLILVDGYRDSWWGWLIYDVCVAGIEGAVHHASAARFRELFNDAGFDQITQKVHPGFAPFLLNEAVAPTLAKVIPAPHFGEVPEWSATNAS